jgi:hypothetical protein
VKKERNRSWFKRIWIESGTPDNTFQLEAPVLQAESTQISVVSSYFPSKTIPFLADKLLAAGKHGSNDLSNSTDVGLEFCWNSSFFEAVEVFRKR